MANNEAAHNQTLTYIFVTDNKVTLDRESIALDRARRKDYLNQHSQLV